MGSLTAQTFLQKSFLNFQQSHRLPLFQIKAAEQLMICRTAALGGHSVYCEDGHLNGVWYNSCHHRSCPQCNALKAEQWLQKTQSLLLDCPHHHWVFTLPHELHPLWHYNRAFCHKLLLQCVRKTLQELCVDPKYLGAQAACILALHTWARNQSFHAHTHCLISHGGIDWEGQWQTPKRKSFLPAKVMMQLFRGKYLAGIRKGLAAGDLIAPKDQSDQQVINLCNKLGRKDWVVHCVKAYLHGKGVAKYLARYIRGGAIKNHQFISMTDTHITFSYRSHQTKNTEYRQLTHEKFILQMLSHIAVPYKQQYQMLGLYHGRCRKRLNEARQLLCQKAVQEITKIDWQQYFEKSEKQGCCKECGKPLVNLKALEDEVSIDQLKMTYLH